MKNKNTAASSTIRMTEIISETIIDQAYEWLCQRRKDYSHHNDVWHLRWKWAVIKPELQKSLLNGDYAFDPVAVVYCAGERFLIWSARDALVLKAVALVLNRWLKPLFANRVYHLAGTGGAKAAVREVAQNLPHNRFVFRTDVLGYYAAIDHDLMIEAVAQYIPDPNLIQLIWRFLRHRQYDNGFYRDIRQGLSLGCPLSPVLGALFLKPLDDAMRQTGLCYARFMDDWVILAPTRWKLRPAIAAVNQILAALKLKQHPDKTFIGYIDKGFDFLGYHFTRAGQIPAPKTMDRFLTKVARLYEQQAEPERLGRYLKNWLKWVKTGVEEFLLWPWVHCLEALLRTLEVGAKHEKSGRTETEEARLLHSVTPLHR